MLDGVVLDRVGEVERRAVARRRQAQGLVDDVREGVGVEAVGLQGVAERRRVDVLSISWQVAVICHGVQHGTWRAAY